MSSTISSELAISGFCVLGPHTVSPELIAACRASQSFVDAGSAASLARYFRQSSPGRHHRLAHQLDKASLLAFEALEQSWLPLVREFFACPPHDGDRAYDFDAVSHSKIEPHQPFYRSELQLLQSQPLSKEQFFHQDNSRRSLTFVVPLVNVDLELGPTQLLAGTHRITRAAIERRSTSQGPVSHAWGVLCESAGAVGHAARFVFASGLDRLFGNKLPSPLSEFVRRHGGTTPTTVQPCLDAGSALVFDSRCIHRGLANLSPTASRPVLIFRYDTRGDVPPNHSVLSTIVVRSIGAAWFALSSNRS